MKIAVIGAGAAGLSALYHCINEGHQCEAFEKTEKIGGTWIYTEKTGLDSNGLPLHTSMYAGLKTNLPKELMAYEDFPYETPYHSFISQPEVLNYIQDFANKFNLVPHIKFLKHVVNVSPLQMKRWSLKIMDLNTKIVETKEFDAVIVCIGNYSEPNMPKFDGMEDFKGEVIHSKDFRTAEPYTKKNVLIIGSGPSGVDIARLVANKANKVIMSFRGKLFTNISANIIKKPIVKKMTANSVTFIDDSEEDVDAIIFCTGYLKSYPFLSPDCEIQVQNNWVKYLYKHVINVKKPTMALIGVPSSVLPFPLFGIQVRFFLAYLKGQFNVTEDEMMRDVMFAVEKQKEKNVSMHYYHRIGLDQGKFMAELADLAKIKPVPPVLGKLYCHLHNVTKGNRSIIYRLTSDEEFTEIGNTSD